MQDPDWPREAHAGSLAFYRGYVAMISRLS
jgi:hypothetical protein